MTERITVMRDGEKIATLNTRDTNLDALVKLMVGRELKETYPKRKDCISDQGAAGCKESNRQRGARCQLSNQKRRSVGICGTDWCRPNGAGGAAFWSEADNRRKRGPGGQGEQPKSPREAIDRGIALVPEDRKKQGALLDVDIRGNISMAILERISKFFTVNQKEEKRLGN